MPGSKHNLENIHSKFDYSMDVVLFLTTIKEKYVRMYEKFMNELRSYSKAIRILAKGYLPISLIPPSKLQAILQQVQVAITKLNQDYEIVLNRLYSYYDMKLVTFGIDYQKNCIIQFPVFVQPYTQSKLTLYQVETVPVPILDNGNTVQSYTQLKIEKPCLAFNDKMYSYKRTVCTYNNNIPVNIPSHPHVLLDRNVLCNCDIEAESNFLLESLAACDEHEKPDLEMYFMVNLVFLDYLTQLNVSLITPIDRNWTSVKQSILTSLDSSQINPKLMPAPIMLKDFIEQYRENRMTITKHKQSKAKFQKFINSFLVDTLIFIAAILTIFLALSIIYILTGQSKLRASIGTLTLQRIRTVEALKTDKPVQNCNSGLLKILMFLNLVIVVSLLLRKLKKSILF